MSEKLSELMAKDILDADKTTGSLHMIVRDAWAHCMRAFLNQQLGTGKGGFEPVQAGATLLKLLQVIQASVGNAIKLAASRLDFPARSWRS